MYSHHSNNGSNTAGTPKFRLNDTLVEIDGWKLVKPLYPQLMECQSYIVHMACKARDRATVQGAVRNVTPGGVRTGCVICGELPPDEIVGLEILHNGKI